MIDVSKLLYTICPEYFEEYSLYNIWEGGRDFGSSNAVHTLLLSPDICTWGINLIGAHTFPQIQSMDGSTKHCENAVFPRELGSLVLDINRLVAKIPDDSFRNVAIPLQQVEAPAVVIHIQCADHYVTPSPSPTPSQ